MTYNSKEYWSNRPNPNRKNAEPNAIEKCLTARVTGNVLDFGCGIGRTFPLYENATDVIGLDFVGTYRNQAIETGAVMPFGFHHLIWNVHKKELPFNDRTFETGVLCAVLLHATEPEAIRIISEMGRVCKKVVVVTYQHDGTELAEHVFGHDYDELMKKTGMRMRYHIHDPKLKQIFFEYENKH